ncbi:MAG: hypothetical protein R3E14_09990 [Erythrobacter sp.]
MEDQITRYSAIKKRPNPWIIALIVLIHLGIFYALVRSFAPGAVATVERTVVSAFTVTVTAPPEPEAPEPEGAQGDPGKDAVPKPTTAPKPKVRTREDEPAPRAASTGNADTSGATVSGDGTGAAGSGSGTGSGNGGNGRGGGIAVKPSVRSGELDQARDFSIPAGGRETRFGKSVTVKFTVTTDGTARNCSVLRTSVDPQTTSEVCPLVIRKIRFNPAQRADGTPVEAVYGYRVDFRGG